MGTLTSKMFRPAANSLLRSAARMASQKRCMSEMAFTFAAPNAVHYTDADVRQIDVPSFSGSFGILPNHVPALAVLKPGVVTVFEKEGAAKKFFVSSGTITINDDSSVQILAEGAAKQALSEAQSMMSSASTDEAKAEAQIAVETAEELVKAAEG